MRESEIDGHPARLLLGQSIRVGPAERLDQSGLAVVNVPGGSNNKMLLSANGEEEKERVKATEIRIRDYQGISCLSRRNFPVRVSGASEASQATVSAAS